MPRVADTTRAGFIAAGISVGFVQHYLPTQSDMPSYTGAAPASDTFTRRA